MQMDYLTQDIHIFFLVWIRVVSGIDCSNTFRELAGGIVQQSPLSKESLYCFRTHSHDCARWA